ncbi:uncharacterized protein Eint_050180 [Encephalitozoon intestinalis ATCC 50506]|uniref:Uncharacterized protein n=1 Tax=Encephalitozoon intestinalis (strain ATCC 50506) TaxID=876142 RepID=E0S739_ENCIT|nr:uncharacterized protein Eint_050180 [Encephalitozoon intestinalis ATCC 50506]ADM11467.2 hypothetical protein Eint_050180 [Encephalitozoon intestinalis ATCC 50506]UTX45179.1 putative membrane protein [Encephalitozoon intestinalis]
MEEPRNRLCSTLGQSYKIIGTSPIIPVFLSLTYFTKGVKTEYYTYGIIASGILMGLSLYIVEYIGKKRSEEKLKSLGDISRGFCGPLSKTVDVFSAVLKYTTLLITVDVFFNVLFIYFPFLDEIRKSMAIYKILFGLGLALVGLTLYVFSTFSRKIFLIISASASILFIVAIIAGYFLGINSALPKPSYSQGSLLPSFFWVTTIAFYTAEFISGGVKIIGESMHRESAKYVAITSSLSVSGMYLVLLHLARWIRSSYNSLDILNLMFLRSSKLNTYLRTSTIDKYCITTKVMCILIPIVCISLFVIQFDSFVESFKNLVNAEGDTRLWLLSLLVLSIVFIQVLFNEIIGPFHFYVVLFVIGMTPLLVYHPFICYIFASKKIKFFTAVCILAMIFTSAALVGTIRTLIDILQKN